MNGRYLFRAKSTGTGEWVQGHIVTRLDLDEDENKILNYYIFEAEKEYHPETPLDMIHVHPKTIGQCTGLKDNNGKLIFEGDILKTRVFSKKRLYKIETLCEAIFANGCFRLYLFSNREDESLSRVWGVNNIVSEVVGNIHENPELKGGV